jgi:excisionase family DNA binding protein
MKPITTEQAAKILGVSKRRVTDFCREGRIGMRLGKSWLIDESECRRFARQPRPTGRPPQTKED